MTLRINTKELELIFQLLIQRMKRDNIEIVEIKTDYYWLVTSGEWDNFTSSSPDMVVGSLVDDWESLQKVLQAENRMTYLNFERFASILRAVSETIVPSK